MHPSIPPADSGTDSQPDPTSRHGDVDTNGDLVDELDRRLLAVIEPAWPALADAQLAAVRRMLHVQECSL